MKLKGAEILNKQTDTGNIFKIYCMYN